jgi:hypothetical protein
MTFSSRFGRLARYNILVPIAVLAAVAAASSPALAQPIVVNNPDNDGVELTLTENALTNNSDITNGPGDTVVYGDDPVDFITNNAGATITGDGNSAIGIDDNIGTLTNDGTITTDENNAIGVSGIITTFINRGTITTTDATSANAVGTNGGFGSFFNGSAGIITSPDTAIGTNGSITSFENAGTITGGTGAGLFVNGTIGTFLNSGTMSGSTAAEADDGGTTFTNTSTGVLTGTNGNGFQTQGDFTTFTNAGTISGTDAGVAFNNGSGVANFTNSGNISGANDPAVKVDGNVGTFANSGTLTSGTGWTTLFFGGSLASFVNSKDITNTGTGNAIEVDGGAVDIFSNAGSIVGGTGGAPAIGFFNGATVDSFTNSGTIVSPDGRGIVFDGAVQTFNNAAGGSITGFQNGVTFNNGVVDATNAGSIISTAATGQMGVRIDGGGLFTNSGLIEGAGGVHFNGAAGTLVNSGTIRQTDPSNVAVGFFTGGGAADTLRILTGSQIFGRVDFDNDGADTFDFASFYGTTVLEVNGFGGDDTLVAGDRPYAWLAPNIIAIIDPTGNTSIGPTTAATLVAVRDILGQQLGGLPLGGLGGDDVLNYAPQRQPTGAEAATAVLSDLDVGGDATGGNGVTIWGQTFGGFSNDTSPVNLATLYGGIVAGTHVELMEGTTLGGLASYAHSNFTVAGGQHTIASDTGVVGLYGQHDAGVVTVDFSLLGGGSGHSSSRQVVNLGVLETATANFSSWYVSPGIGVSIPVLETSDSEIRVAVSTSYIHGEVSGYNETTPTSTVAVGALPIRVWEGRVEVNGATIVGQTEHGNVTVNGRMGLFAQSNMGGSTLPFTTGGATINYVDPGSTGYGLYAGAGITADIASGVEVSASVNGSARSDGLLSGGGAVGLSGDF